MAVKQDCCALPQGRVFLGGWGGVQQATLPAGGVITPQTSLIKNAYIGLTEGGEIQNDMEEPSVANTDTRGAGLACYTAYVKKSSMSLSVMCGRAETVALAAYGIVTETATGTVTGELHTVVKNAVSAVAASARNTFVPFNYAPDLTVAPVIKNVAGTTTYVVGTDYILAETGIEIPPTSSITDSAGPAYAPNLSFSYTRLDTQRVDGLVQIAQPLSLYFDGFDRISGAQRQGWVYNARGMAKTVPMKSKDVVKIDFTFTLLPDPRIPYTTVNPTSQYFHFLNS